MPSDRDTAALALAEAMGWEYLRSAEAVCAGETRLYNPNTGRAIEIPQADEPLWKKLAFVGRLAEAVGARDVGVSWTRLPFKDRVCFILSPDPRASDAQRHEKNVEVRDGDLVLAGMLAAAEAARSKR